VKHGTMARRRLAQAKKEATNLAAVVNDTREDLSNEDLLRELIWLKNYAVTGLVERLNEAMQSAQWAVSQNEE
jgi:hypothetical protein